MIAVGPEPDDMIAARNILGIFADASGLRTNLAKSEIFPIRCTDEQVVAALERFLARAAATP